MSKILYFDVETTGLDPVRHDIIQLAGIIVADGAEEEFEFKIQAVHPENASQEALDVHHYTLEDIAQFTPAREAYNQFTALLSKYVNKFDKNDKFTPAGYNVRFDIDFLNNFFKKNDDQYYGSFFNWKPADPLPILHFLDYCGKIKLPNYKLTTVCEHYGIEIQAHDALSDIRATREVIKRIYSDYFRG